MKTQPFTVEDLFLHQKVTELDAAPDGQSVACTVRSVDREKDEYISCIWSLPVEGFYAAGRGVSTAPTSTQSSTSSTRNRGPRTDRRVRRSWLLLAGLPKAYEAVDA